MSIKTTSRDGVNLSYLDAGQGSPALFLIHGWGCDHRIWQRQVTTFSKRHRVVALDLRGHGDSDAPKQDYTLHALADDATWLCQRLKLDRPVIVGHRMGGLIALQLANSIVKASGLILISTRLIPRDKRSATAKVLRVDLTLPSYREAASRFAKKLFLTNSDPDLVQWVSQMIENTPQHVLISTLDALSNASRDLATHKLAAPTLHVLASNTTASTVEKLTKLYPDIATAKMTNAGQMLQLEAADQFNAMIRGFMYALPKDKSKHTMIQEREI